MPSQEQMSQEHMDVIIARYRKYLDNLNEDMEPVTVFDPLAPKQLEELQLIRELSQELQAKKEEDIRKAALAKEEAKMAMEEKEKDTEKEAPAQEDSKKEE